MERRLTKKRKEKTGTAQSARVLTSDDLIMLSRRGSRGPRPHTRGQLLIAGLLLVRSAACGRRGATWQGEGQPRLDAHTSDVPHTTGHRP